MLYLDLDLIVRAYLCVRVRVRVCVWVKKLIFTIKIEISF